MSKSRATRAKKTPMEEVVNGLMDELKELRREVAALKRPEAIIPEQLVPVPAVTISSAQSTPQSMVPVYQPPVMMATPIASSSLPDIDIVPPSIKKEILKGKDINLASLLLPLKDRRYVGSERDLQIGDEILTLKSKKDNRLLKDLTIAEFIKAFNIFKRVMCSHYPHRRDELDNYLSFIIDISAKFPGFAFYQYHLQFSAKSAEYIEQGIRMDWGTPDASMLNLIVAGHKANACSLCQAFDHSTSFCSLTADKPAALPAAKAASFESRDSPCKYYNYSVKGCFKKQCIYRHVCASCFLSTHKANDPQCRKPRKQD